MGDSISDGTLIEYTVTPGQGVKSDEIIARIETDKVTVDVRVPSSGIVKTLKAKAGEIVAVGAELIELESPGSASSIPSEQSQSTKSDKVVPSTSPSQGHPTGASSKPSSSSTYSSPSAGTPSTAVDSHQQRAHSPKIHFRYGLRDAEGHILGSAYPSRTQNSQSQAAAVQHVASGKSGVAVSKKSTSKTGLNGPHHPSEFFAVSSKEWQADNQRAAEALRTLPEYYRRPMLKKSEWEIVDFGGAENYLTKKEKAALEKEKKTKT